MSYRPIIDKDEEHAKECLDCGKIFYVGEKCPFCVGVLLRCKKCGKFNDMKFLERALTDALQLKENEMYEKYKNIEIKYINMCDNCKTEELCATKPIAVCNER